MNLYQWINDYLNALPDHIRPDRSDDRFLIAAEDAQENGWTPKQAANAVRAHNYASARNPKLVAIMRLEDHGSRSPATTAQKKTGNASGCLTCPPAHICDDPVTPENKVPAEWVGECMALIRELSATPGLSDDARERAMVNLIADLRGKEAHTGR